MSYISVLEMFSIGIGPSSSHTLGPWKAARTFVSEIFGCSAETVARITVDLFGSLALTGEGHGTPLALALGLQDYDPTEVPLDVVAQLVNNPKFEVSLLSTNGATLNFSRQRDIHFHRNTFLEFHANGLRFSAFDSSARLIHASTYYSVGGGFVMTEDQCRNDASVSMQVPISVESIWDCGASVLARCQERSCSLSSLARQCEHQLHDAYTLETSLEKIFTVMADAIVRGCITPGTLPGGLQVKRRAPELARQLCRGASFDSFKEMTDLVRARQFQFSEILKWIGCWAIAVNEENAAFGRIVTAPTNGSAGVIPAVLAHFICFENRNATTTQIHDFLLVASAVGSLFKKGATISAAMGGCQAEIGVSAAMAAAALTESCGGTPEHALMAAEIAMEHHLGLTCDPVGGLVQVPCIERNSMGAIKAIMASQIALASDPRSAKVSFDDVVSVMNETARDMSSKYKETSTGGLAVKVPLTIPEC